jgi:RNA-directed DNA polymerase
LSGLDRIRQAARRDKSIRFNNLMHHITIDRLREAYQELKPKAAPGIDDVTWEQYGKELEANLSDLRERVLSGRYRAAPSKRVWIPKPDGKKRPIGIPVLEDKVIQQAVAWILSQIYEEDFVGFSYGFRPGRSQHNALDALFVGITQRRISWILDADIRSFFDTVDHEWMMKFIEHRISDPRMLRLIRKWLRAGVSEEGQWSKTTVGTPQGAVISPLLANIYLHYALDLWVEKWREKQAQGDVIIVRYADDFVMGFQHKQEAGSFLKELRERLAKFGLELHPDKTRLIEFGRFAAENRKKRGEGKPETFDFLGFTHICARTRKGNYFTVRRKTIAKRMRNKIKTVRAKLMQRRHDPIKELGEYVRSVVKGHFNYYAVPNNKRSIDAFRSAILKSWFQALRRRSQKARRYSWDKFKRMAEAWVPKARILHPYPSQRLHVTYPR